MLLIIALGLVGVTALQLTYNVAIDRLPLGIALLIEYLAPVLVVLWVALAPFVRWPWPYPGDGIFWCARWICGDEVICWLRPDGVLEGICWRPGRL